MKIPPGMTEQEVVDTITKVCNRLASKFKFGYFDVEDIKQEAFIYAIQGLEDYDPSKPLENFLSVHIRNRLINLKRNKYARNDDDSNSYKCKIRNHTKKCLMEPLDISEYETNMRDDSDHIMSMEQEEIIALIDRHLDVSLRSDYLRMRAGVPVAKHRREKVHEEICKIVLEYGYE